MANRYKYEAEGVWGYDLTEDQATVIIKGTIAGAGVLDATERLERRLRTELPVVAFSIIAIEKEPD